VEKNLLYYREYKYFSNKFQKKYGYDLYMNWILKKKECRKNYKIRRK